MKIKKISFKKKFKSLLKMILAPSMAFLPGNLAFFMMLSIFPLLTIVGLVASLFSLDVNFIINIFCFFRNLLCCDFYRHTGF